LLTSALCGYAIAPITALVGVMCVGYFGISEGIEHAREGQEGIVTLHVWLDPRSPACSR
jgi:hypothetical protein